MPIQADYYRRLIEEHLGSGMNQQYRIWFIDNAMHTVPTVLPDDPRPVRTTASSTIWSPPPGPARPRRVGRRGVAPPESTSYRVLGRKATIPATAAERRGIQPVPTLAVEGRNHVVTRLGIRSPFMVRQRSLPARPIVEVEWDFEGSGEYPERRRRWNGGEGHLSRVTYDREHTFTEAGTFFPAMRVTSQREGRPDSLYGRIQNIARVRVDVTDVDRREAKSSPE